MKNSILILMAFLTFSGLTGSKSSSDPATWSSKKLDKWFSKMEWSNGWKKNPDPSIHKRELATSYYKNKERWDKAFTFLNNTDLSNLEVKRYDIDGNNLYALVSEYTSKNEDAADFEAHRKYIDIQYVISGKEIMEVTPLASLKKVLVPYDETKDIEFMTVEKKSGHKADQTNFFIFFPSDAHRPGMKDGPNSPVKKIVIKLKVD
jgi:biofilm protein TabA